MSNITSGGNNGIGYATVQALLESKRSYHVLMGCRSRERAAAAIESLQNEFPDVSNRVEAVQVDITSDESIEKAFETVSAKFDHIDVLINNAGAAFGNTPESKLTLREAFNKTYDVNLSGTHIMTYTFIRLLLRSSDPRLLFVAGLANATQASEKYFPTPPQPAGWPKKIAFETIPYRCSKVALNMLMLDWNHKLQADGVKVWSVGPGFLKTDLGGMRHLADAMGCGPASLGGEMLLSVVEGERDADVGKIVIKSGLSSF
ncbi:unnamed protein product [Sphagnum balticum]